MPRNPIDGKGKPRKIIVTLQDPDAIKAMLHWRQVMKDRTNSEIVTKLIKNTERHNVSVVLTLPHTTMEKVRILAEKKGIRPWERLLENSIIDSMG